MTRNPTFHRALTLLAHPFTLGALALLLFNDHVLRRLWPSWWTGKLGDFAWLFFAPFALAAVIAWVLPRRVKHHEQVTFAAAFALTGLIFGFIKSIPAVYILAMRIFASAGMPLSLRRDPSDLLALPALVLAFWLWRRTASAPVIQPRLFPARGLIALPLAALLTIANSPAPDFGIECISIQPDGSIVAGSMYNKFTSTDGGQTWQHTIENIGCDPDGSNTAFNDWAVVEGPSEGISYRYLSGQVIERSTDGGQTWQPGITLEPVTEAEQAYYESTGTSFNFGPNNAVPDPNTQNMLFAMGAQGILIHTIDNDWQWIQVGQYGKPENFPSGKVEGMMFLPGIMAFLLLLLIYCTLEMPRTFHWFRFVVLILAWLIWLFLILIAPPPVSIHGYFFVLYFYGVIAFVILILPLIIWQTVRLIQRSPERIPVMAAFGLLGAMLFMLPFLLWVYSTIPTINVAVGFAIATTLAVIVAGFLTIRSKFPKTA